MNPEFITRVVSLVQKTNDRVVLADPQTGKAVVLLDLDSYEKMCDSAAVAKPAEKPVGRQTDTEKIRLPTPRIMEKSAQISEIPIRTRTHVALDEQIRVPVRQPDLTPRPPPDIMNRDIGTRKTATDSRKTEEFRPAVQRVPQPEPANVFEAEERFYLEPLE